MSIEILTRINPKVSNMESIGISTAGGLTSADVSAACAGINKKGELMLLAKICGVRGVQEPLFYRMYNDACKLAVKGNWRAGKRGLDRIRSVLQLAIYESITQMICPTCRGTKFNPRNPTKTCSGCDGKGIWRMTDADKYRTVGISQQSWNKTWKWRFNDMLILLEKYEYSAKRKVLNRLK
ncbi:MAG: hypothetical protein ABFS03_00850 [Chloroflexota bacterium]